MVKLNTIGNIGRALGAGYMIVRAAPWIANMPTEVARGVETGLGVYGGAEGLNLYAWIQENRLSGESFFGCARRLSLADAWAFGERIAKAGILPVIVAGYLTGNDSLAVGGGLTLGVGSPLVEYVRNAWRERKGKQHAGVIDP